MVLDPKANSLITKTYLSQPYNALVSATTEFVLIPSHHQIPALGTFSPSPPILKVIIIFFLSCISDAGLP